MQVANQIYWCQEVEAAFEEMRHGNKGAMRVGMCAHPGPCSGGLGGVLSAVVVRRSPNLMLFECTRDAHTSKFSGRFLTLPLCRPTMRSR